MAKKKGGGKLNIQSLAGLTVGGIVASKVSNIKLPIALPPIVQTAIPLVVGVFLYRKPGFIGDVGKGMIAVGGIKLVNAIAPKLGIGDATEDNIDMNGAGGDYALAGASQNTFMNGTSYALAGTSEVEQSDRERFG